MQKFTHITGQEQNEGLSCYQKYLNVIHEFASESNFENQSNYTKNGASATSKNAPLIDNTPPLPSMIPNPWDDNSEGVVNNMGS